MYEQRSGFRGLAGEVVVSFLDPATIFLAIPVLLYFGVCSAAIAFAVPDGWFPLDLVLVLVMGSFAVSRYAIPAYYGAFDDGWLLEHNSIPASLQFCLRYLIFTAVWAIPVAGALAVLESLGQGFSPGSMMGAGFAGVVMLVVLFVMLIAPALGFIAATAATEPAEMVRPDLWRALLVEQRANLIVFYAAAVGGVIVFWLVYGLPLLLLTTAGFAVSPQMGEVFLVFVVALPAGMMPMLIGRLAGALVRGEILDADVEDDGSTEPTPGAPTPTVASHATAAIGASEVGSGRSPRPTSEDSGTPIAAPYEPPPAGSSAAKVAFSQMLKKVDAATPLGMQNALTLAGNLARTRPDDPYVAGEISLLYLKAGDVPAATAAATRCIELSIEHGTADVAARVYDDCAGGDLKLPGDVVKRLLPLFTKQSQFASAHALLINQGLLSEERGRTLADAALKRGQRDVALKILDDASSRWPEAAFIDALLAKVNGAR